MHTEVEPGLIGMHTARRQSPSMAVLPENNEDLTAFGYDYVRMLSAKEPRFAGSIY